VTLTWINLCALSKNNEFLRINYEETRREFGKTDFSDPEDVCQKRWLGQIKEVSDGRLEQLVQDAIWTVGTDRKWWTK